MGAIRGNSNYEEVRVDRIIPGTTHPYLGAVPSPKGTIPLSETLTGTFTASGTKVRGTGTLFLTEITQGDYLYYNGAIRRVAFVISDTLLDLEFAFPADPSGQAVKVPPRNYYAMITIKSTDPATPATAVQEAAMAAGELVVTGGAPISYDMTAGGLEFTCSK